MNSTPDPVDCDDRSHRRFCIAVENFIDLYKFIMVLAIGNCVRSLAQRQIQPDINNGNGLSLNLDSVSMHDWFMFAMVLIFIARFFLGDLSYWKSYTTKNSQVQITDAINLLINSFLLTYMSFFIGYTHQIFFMICIVLALEIAWAVFRWIEGRFRTSEGELSQEINLGLIVSFVTIVVVVFLGLFGHLPLNPPNGAALTQTQKWIVVLILFANNLADLVVNGGRYMGANENSWGLTLILNRPKQ